MSSGELRAEYASFTDMHTFYDTALGAKDATDRIYFEVAERPENILVLEKDDSGRLIEMNFPVTSSILNDIFSESGWNEDNLTTLLLATGSQFNQLSDGLVSGSIQHLNRNTLIGSKVSENSNKFSIDKKNLSFSISNSVPFPRGPSSEEININDAPTFLLDDKMQHIKNTMFLPPVNEDGTNFGEYTDFRNIGVETFEDVKQRLGTVAFSQIETKITNDPNVRSDMSGDFEVLNRESLVPVDSVSIKEFSTINFTDKSEHNNIFFQIFETNSGSSEQQNTNPLQNNISKLDLIEAGYFYDETDPNGRFEKKLIYAGKVFYDNFGSPSFFNIFTIIMD